MMSLKRYWAVGLLAACAAQATHSAAPLGGEDRPPALSPAHLHIFGIAPAHSGRGSSVSRLDGALGEISQRYPAIAGTAQVLTRLHAINPAARFRQSTTLSTPEVLIDAVSVGNPQALSGALQALGMRDVVVYSNDVGGWLPVDQIANVAAVNALRFARASMPRTRAGVVATQGDFAQGSALLRTANPALTGAGITVGVLSDSFNCYQTYANDGVRASGPAGYASNGFTADYATDQLSGALPAGIDVLEEAPCMDYGAPLELPFSDEGRAILQIVHAVAPHAQLAFYTASNSEADFANGIVRLAQAGAQVIDDDVGYPDEPFFQDGLVAQAIDTVAAQGVAYFSSAGNDGRNSYENTAPTFPVTSSTAPNVGEKLLNFDTTAATTTTTLPLRIPSLQPGEFVFLVLQWDQPYVTGAPNSGGATSSLDLCVTSAGGIDSITDIDDFPDSESCTGPNAIGVDPVQVMIIGNSADSSQATAAESIGISIGLARGTAAPGRVKFLLDADGANATINAFETNSPTIQGHPSANGAAAVGAAFYFETPRCDTSPALLESFSSAGGDPILFDASGNRLGTPQIRQKPDFVGPDGVNNSFLGFASGAVTTSISSCQNDTSFPSFFGTSAAAPHAAAAAALMLQANPAVTAAQVLTALRNSALQMAGGSFASGAGFIRVDAALAQLPPAAPSLTVTPTSIALGNSATLIWSSVNTTQCTASGSWSGTQGISGNLSVTASAAGTDTYTLTCVGPGGSAASSVTLTVNAAASSTSGGGGGLDASVLLALGALLLWRRSALAQTGAYGITGRAKGARFERSQCE